MDAMTWEKVSDVPDVSVRSRQFMPHPYRGSTNPAQFIVVRQVVDLRFYIRLDWLGALWGGSQAENAGSIPVARSRRKAFLRVAIRGRRAPLRSDL